MGDKKVYSLAMTTAMLKAVAKKEKTATKQELLEKGVLDTFADWLCEVSENIENIKFE
jgi:hypothetical protein